jgi:hypothetical protein
MSIEYEGHIIISLMAYGDLKIIYLREKGFLVYKKIEYCLVNGLPCMVKSNETP